MENDRTEGWQACKGVRAVRQGALPGAFRPSKGSVKEPHQRVEVPFFSLDMDWHTRQPTTSRLRLVALQFHGTILSHFLFIPPIAQLIFIGHQALLCHTLGVLLAIRLFLTNGECGLAAWKAGFKTR
jgi:hypothetical protein